MHTKQKIALLHYWLLGMRGGEIVLKKLCEMFPYADLYTHAAIKENLPQLISQRVINESFISKMPWGRYHCQKYLPLMPIALKQWNFSNYDIIISSESGPVKGINKPSTSRHICYCHTPMRYLWDMYDEYYENTSLLGKIAMRASKNYLRKYDLKSAESVDEFIANSNFVAERIKRIYQRDATVIYPPVDVEYFNNAPEKERKHYLFVGQFVCYKRTDLVIESFKKLQDKKLIVVGEGPLFSYLRRIAPKNVQFTGWICKEKLRELYASSKALIFPGIEDFGIVPVEATATNCPVIAMNKGGTAESIIDKKTGILLKAQTVEEIINAIEEVAVINWHKENFKQQSIKFDQKYFEIKINKILY